MKSYNLFAITLMLSSTSLYATDSLRTHDQPPAVEKSYDETNHKAELQQPMPVPGDTLIFKKDSKRTGVFFWNSTNCPYSLSFTRSQILEYNS